MFGIGGTEILVILVVALIVFGPQKLPDLARTLGKALGEFRRVSTDFQRTLNTEIEAEEHEKRKTQAEAELSGEQREASGRSLDPAAPGPASPQRPDDEATPPASAPRPDAPPAPDAAGGNDNRKGAA